jgi:hypothetical protein
MKAALLGNKDDAGSQPYSNGAESDKKGRSSPNRLGYFLRR